MGKACSTYEGKERCIQILVGQTEGKRPLERPMRRWEENINIDLQKVECGVMEWIDLAQDRDRRRAFVNR